MTRIGYTLLAFFIAGTAVAQSARLEIVIKNIKTASGNIRVGLFNNEKDFLKSAVEGKVVKASGGEVTVVFDHLRPGDYAISVIHDENDNGKLDTNMMGIPKEGFAFGNNAMGSFGPPSYDKAKVTLRDDLTCSIDVKYL